MNLCELVIAFVLLTFSSGLFCTSIRPLGKNWASYCEKKVEYERDRFIAETFSQMCDCVETDNEDFDKWGKLCLSMFYLNSLSVEKISSSQELCCQWEKDGKTKYLIRRKCK